MKIFASLKTKLAEALAASTAKDETIKQLNEQIAKSQSASATCATCGVELICPDCDGDEEETEEQAKALGTAGKSRVEIVALLDASMKAFEKAKADAAELQTSFDQRVANEIHSKLTAVGHKPLPIGAAETTGTDAKQLSRAAFTALKPEKQLAFVKSGGQITD
jgi:hypothetical protein